MEEPTNNVKPKATTEKTSEEKMKKKNDFLVRIWEAVGEDNHQFLSTLHRLAAFRFELDDIEEILKIKAVDTACVSYIWYCLMKAEMRRPSGSAAVVRGCHDELDFSLRSLVNREEAYRHCRAALVLSLGEDLNRGSGKKGKSAARKRGRPKKCRPLPQGGRERMIKERKRIDAQKRKVSVKVQRIIKSQQGEEQEDDE